MLRLTALVRIDEAFEYPQSFQLPSRSVADQ